MLPHKITPAAHTHPRTHLACHYSTFHFSRWMFPHFLTFFSCANSCQQGWGCLKPKNTLTFELKTKNWPMSMNWTERNAVTFNACLNYTCCSSWQPLSIQSHKNNSGFSYWRHLRLFQVLWVKIWLLMTPFFIIGITQETAKGQTPTWIQIIWPQSTKGRHKYTGSCNLVTSRLDSNLTCHVTPESGRENLCAHRSSRATITAVLAPWQTVQMEASPWWRPNNTSQNDSQKIRPSDQSFWSSF